MSLLVDRIGEVVELDDDAFEPPPDTLHGPTRELINGAFKLDGRLMLALDTARATDTRVRRRTRERTSLCVTVRSARQAGDSGVDLGIVIRPASLSVAESSRRPVRWIVGCNPVAEDCALCTAW